MNEKGQVAFEVLLLTLVIISSSILLVGVYLQINDDTIALGITRAETNKQLAGIKENIMIEKIGIQKTSLTTTITIKLSSPIVLDTTAIKTAIASQTKIKEAVITVN
ncbi:MAG: hypothetical protein NTY48_03855 [Candidatus Diapherotrites archaeon]|nr:hypothetical protein [Candidatus Diapherotrites archaeon]